MTLTDTLRVEERYLQFQDLRAMDYCEKRWQQDGRPATRWEMVNFLERMLRELRQNGIGYPKVLLLRKKEIQRRTFTLEPHEEISAGDAGDACPPCRGKKYILLASDQPSLCLACLGRGRKKTP
jgi:hypothetical protein